MSENEKQVIVLYNGYEIEVTIKNDFEECKDIIKKKLYLQDKDLDKMNFSCIDEDGYNLNIEEDTFEDAFKAEKWNLELIGNDIANDEENPQKTPQVDMEEYKSKIKTEQKRINEKIKKIKEDLINKFSKIVNEKIAANNSKYQEIIKKLEDKIKSLKEKNKLIIDELSKVHESSVKNILDNISKCAEEKIQKELDNYNKTISENINSQIELSKININKETENLRSTINNINQSKEGMKSLMEGTKESFRAVYQLSTKNIQINKNNEQ